MHLRGLVLFLLVLPGGARRSIRINDSHHDAQQQNNTLANGLEVSAEARGAFTPGSFRTHIFPRAGPQTGALREGATQDNRGGGHFEPHRVAPLKMVGDEDQLPPKAKGVQTSSTGSGYLVDDLLRLIELSGPVGIDATEEQRDAVEAAAAALQGKGMAEPAKVPLAGTYRLLYSSAKGGSNGKLGPLTGSVSQEIVDDTNFVNAVEFFGGALRIGLQAKREVLDDDRIRVSFVETVFEVFGLEVARRPTNGTGVWSQVFVAASDQDGVADLRVMKTPSLFVLKRV